MPQPDYAAKLAFFRECIAQNRYNIIGQTLRIQCVRLMRHYVEAEAIPDASTLEWITACQLQGGVWRTPNIRTWDDADHPTDFILSYKESRYRAEILDILWGLKDSLPANEWQWALKA